MARKFGVPIDLQKLELLNARVQNVSTAPSSPVTGQLYYDTDDNVLYWWNGTTWVAAQAGTGLTDGDKGDITVSASGATWTIDNDVVTYAKMQNVSATDRILGRDTAGAGDVEEITPANVKAMLAIVPGDVTGFDTQVRTSTLNQMTAPTADLSINSHKLTSVTDGSAATDAATVGQVQALVNTGFNKTSVRAATTAAGTLATSFENGDAIDGVTLATGDRILIKDQASGAANGIYIVAASGAPTRATDADISAEVKGGLAVWVNEGTVNGDTRWVLTTNDAITLDTTALVFTQDFKATSTSAGAGLAASGGVLSVGAGTGISVGADSVAVDTAVVYTVGGTDVPVTDGGTGASTAAGAKTNLGFMTRYAANVGDGSATSYNIDHNLGTLDVIVQVFLNSDGSQVEVDVTHSTTNRVVLAFSTAPASNAYRVVVIG